jgi:uncharacterized protein (DUF885 family)
MLDALADQYWQRAVRNEHFLRTQLRLPVETIRPLDPDLAEEDASFARGLLDGLEAVDVAAIDHDRWLTYRTLRYIAWRTVGIATHFWLRQETTPFAGGAHFAVLSPVFAGVEFATAADVERYRSLLHQYAAFVRSLRAFLGGQHRRGIILPNAETDATQAAFEGYARLAQTAALVPDDDRLTALSAGERAALQRHARAVIDAEIVPAFREIAAYLAGPYREGAPEGVGLAQYRGGEEFYRHLVVENTTLTVTPEELQAIGLEHVGRLRERLDEIQSAVGFSGSRGEFKAFLGSDAQFFAATTHEFGERLERYVARAASAVPRFFRRTPRAPYGVDPLPTELAESQTFGYYDRPTPARPRGRYLYNAWHPERTSALGAGALICHELIPGHHFQIALQQENEALPDVRRYDSWETGFVEGWGEYAAELGGEMGVYETPYDWAGRIMQDLMVTVRLVVDTGMNVLGWNQERAMAYMRDHLILSEEQLQTESLRYGTDIPAQALAYKTGELKMLDVRRRAQERLGTGFDIRRFHSWVIDSGSMTLDTLREHVDYETSSRITNDGS